ncbi:MAG: acyl-CoA desaturase [Bacteroidetes bacterium]|nr:acyl-CoA desaturase [Bacteroidota bacterium]
MPETVRFVAPDRNAIQTKFFPTLKSRVDAYFAEKKISSHANAEMVFKTFLFTGGMVLFYCLILFGGFGPWAMLGFSMLLGACIAFIGFNVCHDAIHGGYSANGKVNHILGLLFNVVGANAYVWSITHNVIHHTYTNIPGHDEDIDVAPGMIRLSPEEEWKPVMRYQHLYAFLLYGLASLSWVLRKDYKKFFQEYIGPRKNEHKPTDYFTLFFFKAVYYTIFIVIPLVVLPITWWQFIIGFVAMHLVEGMILGVIFQLAHVVESTEFPYPNTENKIEENWAVHEMRTTANFARKNRVINFLVGGLNFQVEHHLFPQVCHVHYPKIAPIVEATAREFNVPYNDNPTFLGAIQSHYRMLKQFGNPGKA